MEWNKWKQIEDIERVRLRNSMYQIDMRLRAKSTGYTNPKLWIDKSPIEGKSPKQFVWVAFDNGAHEPMLWGNLERLDKSGKWLEYWLRYPQYGFYSKNRKIPPLVNSKLHFLRTYFPITTFKVGVGKHGQSRRA